MTNIVEGFRKLSKEEQLKEGIIITYNRTVSSFVICEIISDILLYNKRLINNELFISIRDIVFNDLFNGFGKLFSLSGRNDVCSLDSLDLNNEADLIKEYNKLKTVYYKEYKDTRDKLTSHLDMITVMNMQTKMVDFKEVENFLNQIKSFIIKIIGNRQSTFGIMLSDVNLKRKQYDTQIKAWMYSLLKMYENK